MSSLKDEKQNEYKVVLVGESGVGKTNLITRYIYKVFGQYQPRTPPTYVKKTIKRNDGKEIILQIWDTVGEEVYRTFTKLFFKNAAGIIIVYDITRKDSFDEIKNYWYQQVKESVNQNVKIVIVGNKFDLFTNGKVDEEEVRTFAKSIGAMFQLTSTLTSSGVDKLFEDLANSFDGSENCQGNNGNHIKKNKKKKNSDKKKFC